MKKMELDILKNAVDMQEKLGFKRISPKRKAGNSNTSSSNWLSVRMDAKGRTSLAFGFDKKLLEKEDWWSEKIRVNISSNGRIVIFELDPNGDYALSGEKGTDRLECKITWKQEICKKPEVKERYEVEYVPMNSKGIKRLALYLPSKLSIEE